MTRQLGTENIIINEIFLEVLKDFESLKGVVIDLSYLELNKTSMRAQPVADRFFFKRDHRRYKIEIAQVSKVDNKTPMHNLPEEVLRGWIAHELGHICDYVNKTWWEIILFGIRYLLISKYKQQAEQTADLYAIHNGFIQEILTTKRYLLGAANLNEKYKRNLARYYYSTEDIEKMVQKQGE